MSATRRGGGLSFFRSPPPQMSGDDEGLPLVQEPSSADLEAGLSAERPATPHDGAAPASPAAAGPLPSDAAMAAATALERDGGSGLASLTRWMEQNVPFLVLLAIVFVYEHWGGARRGCPPPRRLPHPRRPSRHPFAAAAPSAAFAPTLPPPVFRCSAHAPRLRPAHVRVPHGGPSLCKRADEGASRPQGEAQQARAAAAPRRAARDGGRDAGALRRGGALAAPRLCDAEPRAAARAADDPASGLVCRGDRPGGALPVDGREGGARALPLRDAAQAPAPALPALGDVRRGVPLCAARAGVVRLAAVGRLGQPLPLARDGPLPHVQDGRRPRPAAHALLRLPRGAHAPVGARSGTRCAPPPAVSTAHFPSGRPRRATTLRAVRSCTATTRRRTRWARWPATRAARSATTR